MSLLLLMLTMGCVSEPEIQPADLDDLGVVQWHRVEARRCGEIEGRIWLLEIGAEGRASTMMVNSGAPLTNDRMLCINRWKKGLRFTPGEARTVSFRFAAGDDRLL